MFANQVWPMTSDKDEGTESRGARSVRKKPVAAHGDISRKLRALYDSVQDEGIPDHLLDLLEKLDEAENAQSSKTTSRK